MKKVIKIILYIITGVILFLGLAYLYLTDFGETNLLSNEPRKPKIEIPITYNLGWWANQDKMTIEKFEVQIVESNLNLFNSKSLIAYEIAGELSYSNYWKPYINEVHISERIIFDSTNIQSRTIEITPIVKTKEDKKQKGGLVQFKFKNEHKITSSGWGTNKLILRCLDQEKIIEFNQKK